MKVLAGGVSSRTVLIERAGPSSMVLKQSLPKLRVAVDWFSSPERIHREALALRWFPTLAQKDAFTELYFEDTEEHLIAMEAVPQPHANWKTMLLDGDLRMGHVRRFAELLATLHRNSAGLREPFADKSFFETLRIEPYYRYTAQRAAADFFAALIDDTLATNVSIVHGDYSPKNVLIHGSRMVLLDHEVAHFGDPAFDVGFAMAHFLSKAHHLQNPGVVGRSPWTARDALVTLPEPEPGASELARAPAPPFFEAAQFFWQSYAFVPYPDFQSRCVRHSLACLLARVWGRSPLEYLGPGERSRQALAVLALIPDAPANIPDMIAAFEKELACR